MLEYEKKLHLDQHYEKMLKIVRQGNSFVRLGFILLKSSLIYTMVFYLLRYTMIDVPDIDAWKNSEEIFKIGRVSISHVDLIYYVTGFLAFCYGSQRLSKVTCQNHSVRVGNCTESLLMHGYYEKVRHPMYGTFVILSMAIFLSVHSLIGFIVAGLCLALQYFNASIEEKKLRNLFGKEYMLYCRKTRSRLLTKVQVVGTMAGMMITLLGFVI